VSVVVVVVVVVGDRPRREDSFVWGSIVGFMYLIVVSTREATTTGKKFINPVLKKLRY
jgi:hypothetical protein